MMQYMMILNTSIELAGLMLCVLSIYGVLTVSVMDRKSTRYVLSLLITLMLYINCNLVEPVLQGRVSHSWWIVNQAVYFIEYLTAISMSALITWYLLNSIDPEGHYKLLWGFFYVFFSVEIVLLCVSQFENLYYEIDAASVYHRAGHYWLNVVLMTLPPVIDLVLLFLRGGGLSKRMKAAFGSYLVLPVLGTVLQVVFPNVLTIIFGSIMAVLILFINILGDQTETYYRKEREIAEMRVEIMLTQIQPHFLYNTLDSIYYLCGKEPQKAQKAISDFSEYLRGNLRSLKDSAPVPFSTEREHVEIYLALEKVSSEDTLDYSFDCETEGFLIPSLTVQPLVENAVKHGIGKRHRGGTVTVRTRSVPEGYQVIVEDDGVGFDPTAPLEDDKMHIGLENVRSRLAAMSGGTLEFISAPGQGTRAVITIPKRRQDL